MNFVPYTMFCTCIFHTLLTEAGMKYFHQWFHLQVPQSFHCKLSLGCRGKERDNIYTKSSLKIQTKIYIIYIIYIILYIYNNAKCNLQNKFQQSVEPVILT